MTTTLWLRDNEEFLAVRDDDPGNCTQCGQPLIEGWFRWTDYTPDPTSPFAWGGKFTDLRHADGSPSHGDHGLMAKNRCPQCKGEDLSYRDTGYGWVASCGCGWTKYTDSGD